MNDKIKGILIGLLILIIEILVLVLLDGTTFAIDNFELFSIFVIAIFIITLFLSLFFIFRKKKTILTQTIGKCILIMYPIFLIFYMIIFPIIQRSFLQQKCNQYGDKYELKTNDGSYPTVYYWVCVNPEGKAINPEDGNIIPDYWDGSD